MWGRLSASPLSLIPAWPWLPRSPVVGDGTKGRSQAACAGQALYVHEGSWAAGLVGVALRLLSCPKEGEGPSPAWTSVPCGLCPSSSLCGPFGATGQAQAARPIVSLWEVHRGPLRPPTLRIRAVAAYSPRLPQSPPGSPRLPQTLLGYPRPESCVALGPTVLLLLGPSVDHSSPLFP